MIAKYRNPTFDKSVLCEAWECVRRYGNKLGSKEKTFEIWNLEFKTITNIIDIGYDIDRRIKGPNHKNKKCVFNQIKGYLKENLKLINEVKKI